MTAGGLQSLFPSQGGQGQEPPPLPAGPAAPPAMAVGGPMMIGPGGINTRGNIAAEQALAQRGYTTHPSLAALTPQMPLQPMAAPGQVSGMPGLPGTTLNSPSQLQMALMSGAMNPYDLYAGQGAGGFGSA
jgi:hypothetical protein